MPNFLYKAVLFNMMAPAKCARLHLNALKLNKLKNSSLTYTTHICSAQQPCELMATVLNRHRACPALQEVLLASAKAGLSIATEPAGKNGKSRQSIEYRADEKAELKSHLEN